MTGGIRLLLLCFCIGLCAATVLASDSVSSVPNSAGPPVAKQAPVTEDLHGHKLTDPYRWLEDSQSPETQQWVQQELKYTRSLLDPLPGRDELHKRLTGLLSIGTIGAPQLGGKYYFYTKREGTQNQPVLYVREGLNDKDRALVDVNSLSADGTIAL